MHTIILLQYFTTLKFQFEASDHVLSDQEVDDANNHYGGEDGGDQHRGRDVPRPSSRHGLWKGQVLYRVTK